MNEITVGILALVLLLLLFATGIELGFAMALMGFVGFAYLNGFRPAMQLVRQRYVRCYNKLWVYGLSSLYPHGSNRL